MGTGRARPSVLRLPNRIVITSYSIHYTKLYDREFFITGLRIVAVSEGKDVSASMAGKLKTFAQIIAIGFLMMEWPFGDVLLWIAVALTLYSGAQYVLAYFKGIV